jgi:hypothetical protein
MYIIGLIAGFFFMVYCFGHVNDEIWERCYYVGGGN